MYKGVYKGTKADSIDGKILILGESHYDKEENNNFTTDEVVNENYRNNPTAGKYAFFHKIAQSFGVNTKDINTEFEMFWDYVYFGNYVEDLCGVGDSRAKSLIKKNNGANRLIYNNNLFKFINDNEIKYIFVFSRLVFNKLPSLNKENRKQECLKNANNRDLFVNSKKDWISNCKFLKNCEHQHATVILKNDIIVYNMRHPSARCGFDYENYCDTLGNIFNKLTQ